MRGRKPVPDRIKQLAGSEAQHRKTEVKADIITELWPPPDFLGVAGRELWYEAGNLLISRKMLTDLDRSMFAALCECWNLYCETAQGIQERGLLVRGRENALKKNPSATILSQSRAKFVSLCERFGLDPLSRQRLGQPITATKEPTKYEIWQKTRQVHRQKRREKGETDGKQN